MNNTKISNNMKSEVPALSHEAMELRQLLRQSPISNWQEIILVRLNHIPHKITIIRQYGPYRRLAVKSSLGEWQMDVVGSFLVRIWCINSKLTSPTYTP